MINNKIHSFITFNELLSAVRTELKTFYDLGLTDDSLLIKEVLKCNEKMGLVFSEMKQIILEVNEFKAELPVDFYKVYYMAALSESNFNAKNLLNPWDNTQDQTTSYEADIRNGNISCEPHTLVIYKKVPQDQDMAYYNWAPLSVSKYKQDKCYMNSPIRNYQGKHVIDFTDSEVLTPFRTGELYMMYLAAMRNEQGELLVPFHPLITPWYEAVLAEKILYVAIMNSDENNLADKYKLAQQKVLDTWLDAWNFTTDRTYQQIQQIQRDREVKWFNKYYRLLTNEPYYNASGRNHYRLQ
jgi:hypothetical protein